MQIASMIETLQGFVKHCKISSHNVVGIVHMVTVETL